ncbi:response regulator [Aerosakkonema sp. BLCC-F183]|uniref:response regulator n=1 Tax=Aerosakkonema sp. BLCC-F183 TaxID=3342834 RepID=UPI0035B94B49
MNDERTNTYKSNILVVDDTPDNLRLLSAMLTEQGYTVRKALNGELALVACQKALPDIILLDINMPMMNGYEVCQRLKANEKTRGVPVIFISALDDVLDKVKAFDVGGIDYISKPFQEAEVLSRIGNQLKLRSLQLQLEEQNIILREEILERRKAQEALELSEAKNRALLDAIPDLMFRIGYDGIFLDYRIAKEVAITQTSSHKLLIENGIAFPIPDAIGPQNSLVSKNISDVLCEDLSVWVMHYVQQTLLASTMQIGEYVQQIDGIWHAYEVRFVKTGQNEVLALVRDISDRKQAEVQKLQTEALLRMQKEQLEQALSELQQAQVQLIQNEKMVALGQLVAGIAHEINNPINFIYANLNYANEYVQNLLKLIEIYQQEYPNPTPKIDRIIDDIDLSFLIKDAQSLMEGMHRGADRIRQLVLSLRNFSRLDEAEMKSVDIHEGIDSTLLMLQHRLNSQISPKNEVIRPEIKVIKEYANLPKVTCSPSEINQVLMHLLNNAIDALDLGNSSECNPLNTTLYRHPTIRITTELIAANTIKIRIADNGPGIPESMRSRLFDPFFTTKAPGKGTGLGLSISYQIIVQKHGGKLTCSSSSKEGSEFAIEIPIHQTKQT